jgi:hypothetical protein
MTRNKRSLLLHTGALLAAAISATEKIQPVKGKIILDAKPKDLTRLSITAEDKVVEITPRQGGGFTLAITEQVEKPDPSKPQPAKPEGGVDPTIELPPQAMIKETQASSYRASKQLEDALAKVLPMVVERDLGKLDAAALAKVGLDQPARTLTVEVGSQKVSFAVGKETFGSMSTYLRRTPDDAVYLIASTLLRPLDARAPSFMERNLVGFPSKDADRITVETGDAGAGQELMRQDQSGQEAWTRADNAESSAELIKNWVEKVFRMKAAEYLPKSIEPAPQNVARIQFRKGDKRLDELVLAQQEAAEGKKDYFARSAHTGAWVKLNRLEAETVVNDLPAVVAK